MLIRSNVYLLFKCHLMHLHINNGGYFNDNQMKTQIKKIGNRLFIEIPDSIEKLYKLKKTHELSMYIIEKNNSLIINCVLLNSNNNLNS